MSRLYLVRHGETEWNKEQRSQGCSNDIELSFEGKAQADLAAKKLQNYDIDLIYSSYLKRAYETAEKIAAYHNLSVTKCDEFKEINLGEWEGLCFPDIREKYSEVYNVWRETPHLAKIPMAETLIELRERSLKKLMEILKANPDKNILIVSHGITIKVLIAAITGIELANIHKIRQDNTAINIFEYNEYGFQIININDTCHLGLTDVRAFNGV